MKNVTVKLAYVWLFSFAFSTRGMKNFVDAKPTPQCIYFEIILDTMEYDSDIMQYKEHFTYL